MLCSIRKTKDLGTLNKYLFAYSFLVLIGIFSKVSDVLDSKEKNNFLLKIELNHYDKSKKKSIQDESKYFQTRLTTVKQTIMMS